MATKKTTTEQAPAKAAKKTTKPKTATKPKTPAKPKTKDTRIKTEKARLEKFYKDLEDSQKGIAAGLIERAAFMRVECEDLEDYLLKNGWTESFQQSPNCPPYDRARPQGQAYQTLNANYQKIIKQLDAMLPAVEVRPEDDGFDGFTEGREDL